MDLLAGYGSSSDDDDADSPQVNNSQQQQPASERQGLAKGRKILSLAAVLPQHIVDQLAKGGVDDSDDEEHDSDRKKPAGKRSSAKDRGISNLLSDLNAVKPEVSEPKAPKERMGAAFLQSVTVETVKDDGVRDIHGEAPTKVSTVKDESSHPPSEKKPSPKTIYPPVPAPSFRRPAAVPAPPNRKLAPSSSSSSATARPVDAPALSTNSATTATTPAETSTHAARKRSRREMERALRRGDFATALQGQEASVANVQQAQPDAYSPQPETFAVPQHGIKVVPTAIYDPSTGAATTDASGKGRGKNQIHHLMASAANLELARARGLGGAGNTAGQTHRAKAKNKYGW